MSVYANYIPNPSFELGTSGWTTYSGGNIARVGSNASVGSYSLRIRTDAPRNDYGGAQIVVPINQGGVPYSLSLYVTGATEEHGNQYSAGTRITVLDLLPGDNVNSAQQRDQQSFSRTTSGRVAIRNITPRVNANRLVIRIETASTYYKSGSTTVQGPYERSGFATYLSAQSFADTKYNAYVEAYSGPGGYPYYRVIYYELAYTPPVDGGQATVYVDAIKLEQGSIETAYVDGSFVGYVWDGEPHNSPTLNVAQLQASGTVTISGSPVELRMFADLEAHGSITITAGGIESTVEGTVSASGEAGMSGAVELWNYGPMGASGESSVSGGAVLYAIVDISASGTMGPGTGPNTPSAELRKAWPTEATGDPIEVTGTVEMTFPQPISASGSMSMGGSAKADIGYQMIASGEITVTGIATVDDGVPQGAFLDFAIYSTATTDSDPLQFGQGGTNAGEQSGANGQPWKRIYAEFYAPDEQPGMWNRAAYAAVGFKFNNVPAGNYQEITCVQLEASASDDSPGPREYRTAKTIRPLVWADKINYSRGSMWTWFESEDLSIQDGGPSPIEHDPFPVRELTIESADATGFFGDNIYNPPPRTHCVTSLYVKGDGNIPEIEVRVLGKGFAMLGTSGKVELSDTDWIRVEIPFISDESEQLLAIELPEQVDAYPAVISVAGIQTERGTVATEFMHMVLGTMDYYYRYNGDDPELGAFYYANIEERIPLLMGSLEEHAPLSVRISEPEFGLIPNLDE